MVLTDSSAERRIFALGRATPHRTQPLGMERYAAHRVNLKRDMAPIGLRLPTNSRPLPLVGPRSLLAKLKLARFARCADWLGCRTSELPLLRRDPPGDVGFLNHEVRAAPSIAETPSVASATIAAPSG